MKFFSDISSLYSGQKPVISFEFFPPKSHEGLEKVKSAITQSMQFQPDFVTVTYRAASSSRALTHQLVTYAQDKLDVPAVAHLTTYGLDADGLYKQLSNWRDSGIRNILALRGDPPIEDEHAKVQSFENALDLTKFIKLNFPEFTIVTAAYPEGHKDARTQSGEIDYLKQKVDAGASCLVTQLFFDVDAFLRFRDQAIKAGISVPLVPGILPVSSVEQLKKFQEMCNVLVPVKLAGELASVSGTDEEDLKEKMRHLGVQYAVDMIKLLLSEGVNGIHLYTLNSMVGMKDLVAAVREF